MKTLLGCMCLLYASGSIAQSWQQVPVPVTKDLHCIVFASQQVGYIGGADSVLLKTTDGGLTWNKIPYSGIAFVSGYDDFLELDFITDQIGFATVGPVSGVYRTGDGGLTWTPLNKSLSLCYNHALYFTADGDGFVGGSGCFNGEQMDRFVSGASSQVQIQSISLRPTNMLVDIDFNASVGLAVSSGGKILRTTNGGLNWDTIASPLGGQVPLTSVRFVNAQTAYIGYNNGSQLGGLLQSTDGGLTWTYDLSSISFFYPIYHDVYTTQSGAVYVGATSTVNQSGVIMELVDSGLWNMYQVDESIYSITSSSDSLVWGVGENGYVVKKAGSPHVSLEEQNTESSITIFPNPAATTCTVSLPQGGNYRVELYTISGQLLKRGAPGESTLDLSDVHAGMYWVSITNDTHVRTLKLMKQ